MDSTTFLTSASGNRLFTYLTLVTIFTRVGKEKKGKERKRKEKKGKERKRTEKNGKERKRKEKQGKESKMEYKEGGGN
jgi:hypothetical protein